MRRVLSVLAAALLLAAVAAPAASAGRSFHWHRFNPGDPGQHERLICTGADIWSCRYDKLPENQLGLDWNTQTGRFSGSATDIDQSNAWCPEWVDDLCSSHLDRIVVGSTTYSGPEGTVTWWEELILTDGDGVAPMYMFLVPFGVVCPWYETWDEAWTEDPQCVFPS